MGTCVLKCWHLEAHHILFVERSILYHELLCYSYIVIYIHDIINIIYCNIRRPRPTQGGARKGRRGTTTTTTTTTTYFFSAFSVLHCHAVSPSGGCGFARSFLAQARCFGAGQVAQKSSFWRLVHGAAGAAAASAGASTSITTTRSSLFCF